MGWASGSSIAGDVWATVEEHILPEKRQDVAEEICRIFEEHDCDTLQEAERLWEAAGRD